MMNPTCLLTCPHCGHQSLESIVTERSEDFHECDECHLTFAAKDGDCCVYRSYGDTPCRCLAGIEARSGAQPGMQPAR